MIAGVARLGHGSGATTPKVYAGWVNEADRRAAQWPCVKLRHAGGDALIADRLSG